MAAHQPQPAKRNVRKETKSVKRWRAIKRAKTVHANVAIHWSHWARKAFGTTPQLVKLEVSTHVEFHAKVIRNSFTTINHHFQMRLIFILGAFFTQDEKDFANYWIALWSGFCAVSTFMTLTTFLIDTERFKYPERPIVFLSACYFMVSMGYLTRHFIGHEKVACDGRVIKYSSTGQSSCTIVFLLVYYFGMASSIWWVILSFTWFLSAGLKWGNEAISKISHFFHLAAWLIPTLQSISVLVHPAVDGDPLAGICYVGNTSIEHLRNFVLAPYFVYLVIGTTFLLAGFVSLFRIRSVIKQQGGIGAGSKADKLEKLMIRIGIFSVLYTVPATIVIACHLYESNFHDDWMTTLACPCVQQTDEWRKQPVYLILMLKYFMTLVCGITSGIWIWSGKTLESWRKLWRRLCGTKPDHSGAGQVLIKPRPQLPQPYVATTLQGSAASASLLTAPYAQTMGSMASTSHHHLHHHVLKHPMSHVSEAFIVAQKTIY